LKAYLETIINHHLSSLGFCLLLCITSFSCIYASYSVRFPIIDAFPLLPLDMVSNSTLALEVKSELLG